MQRENVTAPPAQADVVSLFALAALLVRNRWRIAVWTLLGGVVGILSVLGKPLLYPATASFYPQGQTEAGRSGLAGLAGQLGVSLPGANQSLSPEFYAMLLHSRAVLRDVAFDTLTVREMGNRRVPVVELFNLDKGNPSTLEERGVNALRGVVRPDVVKPTGVVLVTVETEWPSVSLAIAEALVEGVDAYNQRTRQGQAASERKFVEARLAIAESNVRAAEDRLQRFLNTNRDLGRSPELSFQRDRLQRDLAFHQTLHSSLIQAHEEVRIREVRDTPVITVVEEPAVSATPVARGRRIRVLLALGLGAFAGILITLISGIVTQRRREGDPEAHDFASALAELKRDVTAPFRLLRGQSRSSGGRTR